MMIQFVLYFVIMAIACTISGVVGFGSNILALPFLALFMDIKMIVPILIVALLINNLSRLVKQYKYIDWTEYGKMIIPAFIGAVVGTKLMYLLSEGYLKLMVALILLLVVIKGYLENHSALLKPKPLSALKRRLLLLLPALAGFFQGSYSCGGPIYSVYVTLVIQEKNALRATMMAVAATSSVIVAVQYWRMNLYTEQSMVFIILLAPIILVSYILGEQIFAKMNSKRYMKIISFVMLWAAVMMGYQGLRALGII